MRRRSMNSMTNRFLSCPVLSAMCSTVSRLHGPRFPPNTNPAHIMSEKVKRMGRPPGSGAPPEQQRNPRSVRLNDARWAKLQRLGAEWLESAIDRAREPGIVHANPDATQ